ncbi:hypothetical protein QYF36_002414 [Acer negundo]|nr:hypothetical protein QYF36_002414 [Acer negundo]
MDEALLTSPIFLEEASSCQGGHREEAEAITGGHDAPGKYAGSGNISLSNGNYGGYAGIPNGKASHSYGKQVVPRKHTGNGNTGHSNGNIGDYASQSNRKQFTPGKQVGSDNSKGRKFENEVKGKVMGKTFKVSSIAKAKNVSLRNPPTESTSSGLRFDILSKDVEVTMLKNDGQVNSKVAAGVKNKEIGIVLNVTNQNIDQSYTAPRFSSQKNKEISKKGKKPAAVVSPLEVNKKGVEFYKKSFGLDKRDRGRFK